MGHSHVRFMREGVGRKTEKKSSIGRNKETSTFAIGHHTLDDRHAAAANPFSRRGHYVKTLLGSSAISTSAKIAANATNYSMKQVLLEVVEDTQAALGVVLHASSPAAYLQLARLAWPVVPPMVRAPFAHYIPDFLVLRGDSPAVWRRALPQ